MALRKAHGDSESQSVTSMDEIRRRQGMPFDEFCAKHPWWEWTEPRLARRMIDAQGRAWVPMWEPDPGVGICYDPEITPEAEKNLEEMVRRSKEYERQGGKFWTLDELDALDALEGMDD